MSLDAQRLERTLAFHCAPSLSGIKPADLITWDLPEDRGEELLARYTALLARRGILLRVLRRQGRKCLLLIYRPELLDDWLARRQVSAMLAGEGYPVDAGREAMLDALAQRLTAREFPHEIGLFLGYPPADVDGFRRNKGNNWKLCGLWKVYDQVEEAARQFQAFDRCRAALCAQLAQGKTLAQLLAPV